MPPMKLTAAAGPAEPSYACSGCPSSLRGLGHVVQHVLVTVSSSHPLWHLQTQHLSSTLAEPPAPPLLTSPLPASSPSSPSRRPLAPCPPQ